MCEHLTITGAHAGDIEELYALQLLAFESEAEMIGSRDVPALLETPEHHREDFANWTTLKLQDGTGKIIGAIRYRWADGLIDVGRLMVHPDHRQKGLAQYMLAEVDRACPGQIRELYTCTKSWVNIRLYEKMGYTAVKEVTEDSGLSFVYMRKYD